MGVLLIAAASLAIGNRLIAIPNGIDPLFGYDPAIVQSEATSSPQLAPGLASVAHETGAS